MKPVIAAVATVCFASAALPAAAGELVDLAVINRVTGQRAPVYHHQGRLYVAGTPGERYAVYVANRTGSRVLGRVGRRHQRSDGGNRERRPKRLCPRRSP